jgi:DNA-binding NtrC family response regulator
LLQAPPVSTAVSVTDLSAMERQTIETVLRETDGNKSKTARRLGLTRTQLYVRLRRYRLENGDAWLAARSSS